MKSRLLFLVLIIGLLSCGQEPVIIDLNREERSVVDSLYKEEISLIAPKLDSLCEIHKKKRYQQIKDSLIEIRLEEIESLLPEE